MPISVPPWQSPIPKFCEVALDDLIRVDVDDLAERLRRRQLGLIRGNQEAISSSTKMILRSDCDEGKVRTRQPKEIRRRSIGDPSEIHRRSIGDSSDSIAIIAFHLWEEHVEKQDLVPPDEPLLLRLLSQVRWPIVLHDRHLMRDAIIHTQTHSDALRRPIVLHDRHLMRDAIT